MKVRAAVYLLGKGQVRCIQSRTMASNPCTQDGNLVGSLTRTRGRHGIVLAAPH